MPIYRQMDIELSFLSQNIVKLRALRGMSQKQLADVSKVPRSTISNIELGQANPTLSNVLRIAKSLQVSVDELLNRPTNRIHLIEAKDAKIKKQGSLFSVHNLLPHPVEHIELEKVEIKPFGYIGGSPHSKNTKEYFICLNGSAEITIEGDEFTLKKGDCLIFPGDCRHSYRNSQNKVLNGISVIVR